LRNKTGYAKILLYNDELESFLTIEDDILTITNNNLSVFVKTNASIINTFNNLVKELHSKVLNKY
jgi:hypothetical protein